MLCAITGKTAEEMGRLLQQIVDDRGEDIDEWRSDYAQQDWMEAVQRLGGTLSGTFYSDPKPSLDSWMRSNASDDLIIVATSNGIEHHVFATQGGKVVDFYSDGQIIDYPGPVDRLDGQVVWNTHVVSEPEADETDVIARAER
jgi:hypothetical protein